MTEICLNVRDFGALGDGQTDDTSAFEAALKEAAEGCGTVFVPMGNTASGPYACPAM